jgi:hypothetical protein
MTGKRIEIDVADTLTQLLGRQVSTLVRETADELFRLSGADALKWEDGLYTGLADNCAKKARFAKGLASSPTDVGHNKH